MSSLDVSIIIVNWNSRDLLQKCLREIRATVHKLKYEVIVVDNASTDESAEMVEAEFPTVKLLRADENLGFARANNLGIAQARGKYILLINPDAFLHDGALEVLVEHLNDHPAVAACGPKLLYEDGELQRSCYSFPTLRTELWQALWLAKLFPRHREFGKFNMTYWDFDGLREVDCVMGACVLLRREALDQIGWMDEQFFMYSEEVDLCFRLKQAGWKVMYVPTAVATHVWGGSAQQVPHKQTFLRLFGSRVKFFRKHYGRAVTVAYKGIILVQILLRVLVGGVSAAVSRRPEIRRKIGNYHALLTQLPSM